MIMGEKMPDKNDPKYKERYEREVEAGRKFADAVGISWLAARIDRFGRQHRSLFLVLTFGIVILFFLLNVASLVSSMSRRAGSSEAGVDRMHQVIKENNNQKVEHYENED